MHHYRVASRACGSERSGMKDKSLADEASGSSVGSDEEHDTAVTGKHWFVNEELFKHLGFWTELLRSLI